MQSRSERGPKREWHLYLQDMEEFAQRAISYCNDLSREEFETNYLVQDAVIRNIELTGEARSRIPESIRAANRAIASAHPAAVSPRC